MTEYSPSNNMLPDLRQAIASLAGEKSQLFPNNKKEIGFQWFGIRQADYDRKCSCVGSNGIVENPECTRCYATGYLFTDFLVKGYMWLGVLGVEYSTKPGVLSTQLRNIVLQHARPISKLDFLLELDQDPDTGAPRQPFKIVKQYRIQDAAPIKGDTARVEFWRCNVEERNVDDGKAGIPGPTFTYRGNRSNNEPQ